MYPSHRRAQWIPERSRRRREAEVSKIKNVGARHHVTVNVPSLHK